MRRAHRQVERCFRQAIAVAHRQGAGILMLCATTSLARLWHGEGRTAEARKVLGRIHRRFREGFDTADVRDARALLEEMENRSQPRDGRRARRA
jgi:predicted ATPase